MNHQSLYQKMCLLVLFIVTAFNSAAQEYTLITSAANIISSKALIDLPELSGNANAIIIATPTGNSKTLNPHPTGAWYYSGKWNIFNSDHAPLIVGLTYKVQYFMTPGSNHFMHLVTKKNLGSEGSYIDNPALNNKPNVQFTIFQNHSPEVRPGSSLNRFEAKTVYSAAAGKWYITNIAGQTLFPGAAYNIVISSEGNTMTVPVKDNPDISIKDPKTIIKPTDTITAISKKEPKTIIKPADPIPVITGPIDKKDIVVKKPIPKSYDFSKVHVCIEKAGNYNLPPKAPVTPQPVIPKIKPNGELESVTTVTQPLSGITELMWTAGVTITVGFFPDGDEFLTSKVKHFVKEWETYANITFQFVTDVSTAQIRVGFEMDGTSWSFMGRIALANAAGSKTMNFGWFDTNTEDSEFRRVILHEFGHALGFVHEHQSPVSGIPWDKDKVYAYYLGPPNNWDTASINANIFGKYSKTITNSSAYDPLSIMHYPVDAALTTDGSSVGWNTNLSALDKTFVRQVYPFPFIPPTVSGVLKTGDDCDEIEFTVEYNVVHKSEVEFILQPGYDHHNAIINWWKMIGVPLKGSNGVGALFLNTTQKIDLNMLDKTKPMTFGKAKVLGVHTGLGFTWAPWPAIIGGCRVKFVWRRDSCN